MTPPTPDRETLKRAWLNVYRATERMKRARETAGELQADLYKFIAASWSVVEPSHPFKQAWHIGAICEHLQAVAAGQIQNLLINISPGSAKSMISAVQFPAWMWTRQPGWRSTFASYDSGLSTRDSVRCRGLIESAWYQETFQPQWTFSTDQNEKTYYVNSQKGFRVSTSVTGRGTGWRSDAIICDDPINVSDQFSDAVLERCILWWTNTMHNRLISMEKGSRIVIMQRVSDRDLSGHLLRSGGWEHLMIPMEYDPNRSRVTSIGWHDPRTQAGQLMCESIFPQAVIAETKRTLGEAAYSGQYQQTPAPAGGGILKSHLWKYWRPAGMSNLPAVRVKLPDGTVEERKAVELPSSFDMTIESWDMSFKDLTTSDYVVGQVHAVRGANRYVRDQIRGKMDMPATMRAVRELSGRNPEAHLKLVENKANGPAVMQMLADEVAGLVEVNPEGGKIARASAASIELESGNWYLPHPAIAPWVGNPENPTEGGFLAETVMFPFGANDDQVDAWSQGAIRIQKEKIGGVFSVSDQDIRCDPFEFDPKWPRAFGMFQNYQEVAGIWLARKPETGEHYAYIEYSAPMSDPAQHAAALVKPGDWIPGFINRTIPGRDEKSGIALVARYQKFGLKQLSSIQDTGETEIMDLAEAFRSGKLKVFSNMGRFFDGFRMFRRSDDGKLPWSNCGPVRLLCVAWKARGQMRTPPESPKDPSRHYQSEPAGNTWMGA